MLYKIRLQLSFLFTKLGILIYPKLKYRAEIFNFKSGKRYIRVEIKRFNEYL
jgi:hypothetical protein